MLYLPPLKMSLAHTLTQHGSLLGPALAGGGCPVGRRMWTAVPAGGWVPAAPDCPGFARSFFLALRAGAGRPLPPFRLLAGGAGAAAGVLLPPPPALSQSKRFVKILVPTRRPAPVARTGGPRPPVPGAAQPDGPSIDFHAEQSMIRDHDLQHLPQAHRRHRNQPGNDFCNLPGLSRR